MQRLEVRLRAPRAGEGALCRMLVPAADDAAPRRYRLAEVDRAPHVAGAISWWQNGDMVGGVRVHVVPPLRGLGIGSQLVRSVLETAGRAREAFATADTLAEPDAAGFAARLGFERISATASCEVEAATALDRLAPLVQRPRTSVVTVAPLRDAPPAVVARMYLDHITQAPHYTPYPLAGSLDHDRFAWSRVLLANGSRNELACFILGTSDGETGFINALVVAPPWRGSAAIAVLCHQVLIEAMARGLRRLRFEMSEANRAMISLGRRMDARTIGRREQFRLGMS